MLLFRNWHHLYVTPTLDESDADETMSRLLKFLMQLPLLTHSFIPTPSNRIPGHATPIPARVKAKLKRCPTHSTVSSITSTSDCFTLVCRILAY